MRQTANVSHSRSSASSPASSADTLREMGVARAIRTWLYAMAALVAAMVIVGGATRLTNSGLSITEWKPLLGMIPPLTAADWVDAFAKYKLIPQYEIMNRGMTLDGFKFIFWWEWAHRQLGRFIGVAFLIPFLIFWARGQIAQRLMPKLIALFALGGLQGAVGWYMVQSGLANRIDVSQYRLALHLSIAVAIFGALLWVAWTLDEPGRERARTPAPLYRWAQALSALVLLQVALGGLVAGLKAGLAHNTWPLMDRRLVPEGLGIMKPAWRNLFENALTVQFNHRITAYAITAMAGLLIWRTFTTATFEDARKAARWLGAAILLQIALGIWTLLAHVPLSLGLAHQAGALVVFAAALWLTYVWRYAQN
jgi:heme a synthase